MCMPRSLDFSWLQKYQLDESSSIASLSTSLHCKDLIPSPPASAPEYQPLRHFSAVPAEFDNPRVCVTTSSNVSKSLGSVLAVDYHSNRRVPCSCRCHCSRSCPLSLVVHYSIDDLAQSSCIGRRPTCLRFFHLEHRGPNQPANSAEAPNISNHTSQSSFRPENVDSGTFRVSAHLMLHSRSSSSGHFRIETLWLPLPGFPPLPCKEKNTQQLCPNVPGAFVSEP